MQLKGATGLKLGSRPWVSPAALKAGHTKSAEATDGAAKEKEKDERAEKLKLDQESRMLAEEIVSTGRSQAVETAEQRLEQLLAEIALLEAKQAGMSAEQLAELEAREQRAREVEAQAEKARAEADAHAKAMLEAQEKELAKIRQQAEAQAKAAAEKQRRELLEYRYSLGFAPQRTDPNPFGLSHELSDAVAQDAAGSILDDPAYKRLGPAEQLAVLDMLETDPAGLAGLGFGAYCGSLERSAFPASSSQNGLLDKLKAKGTNNAKQEQPLYDPLRMPGFFCVTTDTVPGLAVQHVIGPVSGSVLRTLQSHRSAATRTLDEDRQHARSEMIRQAIEAGANAILGVKFDSSAAFDRTTVEICAYGTAAVVLPPDYVHGGPGNETKQSKRNSGGKKDSSSESSKQHQQSMPWWQYGAQQHPMQVHVPWAQSMYPSQMPMWPSLPFPTRGVHHQRKSSDDHGEQQQQQQQKGKNKQKKGHDSNNDGGGGESAGWGWPSDANANDKTNDDGWSSNKKQHNDDQKKEKRNSKENKKGKRQSKEETQDDGWGNDAFGGMFNSPALSLASSPKQQEQQQKGNKKNKKGKQQDDDKDEWKASSIGKWAVSSPAQSNGGGGWGSASAW